MANEEVKELNDLMNSVDILSEEGSEVVGAEVDTSSGESQRRRKIREAINLFTQAREDDKNGDYKEGLKYYKKGIECVLPIMKDGSLSEANKQKLITKCQQFMARAETLQKKIKSDEQKMSEEQEVAARPTLDPEVLEFVTLERPSLKFSDVAGLRSAKDALKEFVILPFKFPQLFRGNRKPHHGIMLYGAPGVGKTMLMRAVAGELEDVTYMRASTYDFMCRYSRLDAEKSIRQIFTYAKEHAPTLLALDDFEGLFHDSDEGNTEWKRRIKTEFMVQFASKGEGLIVVGVTLAPWRIDAAIRKRFSKRIEVPLPNEEDRIEIFKHQFKDVKDPAPDLVDEDFSVFAQKTDGYTGADICVLVRDAIMEPVRLLQGSTHFKKTLIEDEEEDSEMVNIMEKFVPCSPDDPDGVEMAVLDIPTEQLHIPLITKEDVLKAIESSKPTVNSEDLKKLSKFTEDFT